MPDTIVMIAISVLQISSGRGNCFEDDSICLFIDRTAVLKNSIQNQSETYFDVENATLGHVIY